jgi:small subunit ribosomal protein S1
VEVVRIDRERGRVSLDFHRVAGSDWKVSIASYSPGDEATGWVSRLTPDGAVVALEEGVEGLIPRTFFVDLDRPPQKGSIVRTRIRKIDHASRRIELEPLD